LESINYKKLFGGIYLNKKVLVTGHSGFKGSWFCKWLDLMGAEVLGYSLEPNTNPNHFENLDLKCKSIFCDIKDLEKLKNIILEFKPEIIFHFAAQPLVRISYLQPYETIQTNIIGSTNLLEIIRKVDFVKAFVNITSDKCYENKELENKAYAESDSLGGYDIYSASKACSELVTASYRDSFFNLDNYKITHNILIATCRAGNVIGGGDWSLDRLIPDIVKSIVDKKKVLIRNPKAVRPWQHVLEPLSGYLLVGQFLLEEKKEFARAWNFGPQIDSEIYVEDLVKKIKKYWDSFEYEIEQNKSNPHEANFLKLDSSFAKNILGWKPIFDIEKCLEKTISWYKDFYEKNKINTVEDIQEFIVEAKRKKLKWCDDKSK